MPNTLDIRPRDCRALFLRVAVLRWARLYVGVFRDETA